MYNFTSDPPEDPRGNSLELKRTPTGRSITGIITCVDMVGIPTHYFHGRTTPCDSLECEPCLSGMPWAWHGYVSLFGPTSHSHILFEMTARAVQPLKTYHLAHGTLRGCQIVAKRINSSPNARVMIETKSLDLQSISLPKEPHLLEALSIIWNIETSAINLDGICKDVPKAIVTRDLSLQRCEPPSEESLHASGNGAKRTNNP